MTSPVRATARAVGGVKGKTPGRRRVTRCESHGPAVKPRGDLGVLVGADCPRWRTQVKIEVEICRRGCRDARRRRCFGEAAQACGAVDDVSNVLESASGRRLPARVEYTRISLKQHFCILREKMRL